MIGTTGLHALRVECIVGIHPHERETRQSVILDIEMDYDFVTAVAGEAIGDAVDYSDVAGHITELAERRGFHLIETMAEETVAMVLARFPRVQRVRLEIRKPAAVAAAASAFVRVERART